MTIRIEWTYAVTGIEHFPGQIAKCSEATGGETSANSQAPRQLAAQPGAGPASQYAPGREVKRPS